MALLLCLNGEEVRCSVERVGSSFEVCLGEKRVSVDVERDSRSPLFVMIIGGKSHLACVRPAGQALEVWIDGKLFEVSLEDERDRALSLLSGGGGGLHGEQTVKALIPGLVRKVEVEVGQQVNKGDGLLILEAMKMENEIRAEFSGTVSQIAAAAGDAVEAGEPLLSILPD